MPLMPLIQRGILSERSADLETLLKAICDTKDVIPVKADLYGSSSMRKVRGFYKNGILELTLPKQGKSKREQVRINMWQD